MIMLGTTAKKGGCHSNKGGGHQLSMVYENYGIPFPFPNRQICIHEIPSYIKQVDLNVSDVPT